MLLPGAALVMEEKHNKQEGSTAADGAYGDHPTIYGGLWIWAEYACHAHSPLALKTLGPLRGDWRGGSWACVGVEHTVQPIGHAWCLRPRFLRWANCLRARQLHGTALCDNELDASCF